MSSDSAFHSLETAGAASPGGVHGWPYGPTSHRKPRVITRSSSVDVSTSMWWLLGLDFPARCCAPAAGNLALIGDWLRIGDADWML